MHSVIDSIPCEQRTARRRKYIDGSEEVSSCTGDDKVDSSEFLDCGVDGCLHGLYVPDIRGNGETPRTLSLALNVLCHRLQSVLAFNIPNKIPKARASKRRPEGTGEGTVGCRRPQITAFAPSETSALTWTLQIVPPPPVQKTTAISSTQRSLTLVLEEVWFEDGGGEWHRCWW